MVGGICSPSAVLVFVFFGVFPKFANYSDAWDAIQTDVDRRGHRAAGGHDRQRLVYVLPYQAAMPGLRYGQAFVVRQTSFMISNVIPAGGAFGLGVQYAMLSGYGFGPRSTTTAIAATSVVESSGHPGTTGVRCHRLVFQGGRPVE